MKSLIESKFPIRQLSKLIQKERRTRDPIYSVHRWWARRPPALMRAILLGSYLHEDATLEEFWRLFGSDELPLKNYSVLDPFMGGGSTLVEASRLGANVYGLDVDPLAVKICSYELEPASSSELLRAGEELLATLRAEFRNLYPKETNDDNPLHYFWIAEVNCPSCGEKELLYRDLILVRDNGKQGAVVRDKGMTVFCPEDFSLHRLRDPKRTRLHCHGRYLNIEKGTFRYAYFVCPSCEAKTSHRDLQTGIAPRRLVGVEIIPNNGRRFVRAACNEELKAIMRAKNLWRRKRGSAPWLKRMLSADRSDERPISFGMKRVEDLFFPRQLLVFTRAFDWIAQASLNDKVATGLRLALSNALLTNNRLCGYARDYGRISGLFSVRGYSLPALCVELNPLQGEGGRGTIAGCIGRVARASNASCRRRFWDYEKGKVFIRSTSWATDTGSKQLSCRSAEEVIEHVQGRRIDFCIFDPPYFDYINYSELSELHRTWLEGMEIEGATLYPEGGDKVKDFGKRLGYVMYAISKICSEDKPIVFTFHSVNPNAWKSLGMALDAAKLSVTALWPVKSDGHMGHHSHDGNCEWDLVFVCRPSSDALRPASAPSVESLLEQLKGLKVRDSDQKSIGMACDLARERFQVFSEEEA